METFWITGRTDMGESNDSMTCLWKPKKKKKGAATLDKPPEKLATVPEATDSQAESGSASTKVTVAETVVVESLPSNPPVGTPARPGDGVTAPDALSVVSGKSGAEGSAHNMPDKDRSSDSVSQTAALAAGSLSNIGEVAVTELDQGSGSNHVDPPASSTKTQETGNRETVTTNLGATAQDNKETQNSKTVLEVKEGVKLSNTPGEIATNNELTVTKQDSSTDLIKKSSSDSGYNESLENEDPPSPGDSPQDHKPPGVPQGGEGSGTTRHTAAMWLEDETKETWDAHITKQVNGTATQSVPHPTDNPQNSPNNVQNKTSPGTTSIERMTPTQAPRTEPEEVPPLPPVASCPPRGPHTRLRPFLPSKSSPALTLATRLSLHEASGRNVENTDLKVPLQARSSFEQEFPSPLTPPITSQYNALSDTKKAPKSCANQRLQRQAHVISPKCTDQDKESSPKNETSSVRKGQITALAGTMKTKASHISQRLKSSVKPSDSASTSRKKRQSGVRSFENRVNAANVGTNDTLSIPHCDSVNEINETIKFRYQNGHRGGLKNIKDYNATSQCPNHVISRTESVSTTCPYPATQTLHTNKRTGQHQGREPKLLPQAAKSPYISFALKAKHILAKRAHEQCEEKRRKKSVSAYTQPKRQSLQSLQSNASSQSETLALNIIDSSTDRADNTLDTDTAFKLNFVDGEISERQIETDSTTLTPRSSEVVFSYDDFEDCGSVMMVGGDDEPE